MTIDSESSQSFFSETASDDSTTQLIDTMEGQIQYLDHMIEKHYKPEIEQLKDKIKQLEYMIISNYPNHKFNERVLSFF